MSQMLLAQELKKLRRFDEDIAWFQKNYAQLKRKYRGEYVAVKNHEIVDHDKDAKTLLKRLKKKFGDLGSLVVEYISERKVEYVL